MEYIKKINFIKKLFSLKQEDEEIRRTEKFLNVILFFSIFVFFIINVIRLFDIFFYKNSGGIPLLATLSLLIFFIFLLFLSRKGKIKTASFLLILAFSVPTFYSLITWGADLPAGLILSVLLIILSGILLGQRSVFISTIIIAAFLIIISAYQSNGFLKTENYWRSAPVQIADALSHSLLIIIIAAASWLFCQEIKKSLNRARHSEAMLKKERDDLEITVNRRTKELLSSEAEKITQLYRLAEFGRLSSGIFHDLINPLSAISLNLEQIENEGDEKIKSVKSHLSQALVATHRMQGLISGIKNQISRKNCLSLFSINQEISQSLEILAYKARQAKAEIFFSPEKIFFLKGDALKFGQIITNILANAIEALCESIIREIKINLYEEEKYVVIKIKDSGKGISLKNQENIFKPFFSTKRLTDQGFGIGLAMTKNIIEKDFKGEIKVESELNKGACFIITLPKENKNI